MDCLKDVQNEYKEPRQVPVRQMLASYAAGFQYFRLFFNSSLGSSEACDGHTEG